MLVACLAFLVMRIGGAHLHHCFDGSEPENAVHFADAGPAPAVPPRWRGYVE